MQLTGRFLLILVIGAWCRTANCKNCKTTAVGTKYAGTTSVTKSGATCLKWEGWPTPDGFPEDTVANAKNYCRNPDSDASGPWCFTSDQIGYGYCNIPLCGTGKNSGGTSLKDLCLFAHNKVRALHQSTPPVTYDDQIAAGAQKWANHLKGIGGIEGKPLSQVHEQNTGLGENVGQESSSIDGSLYSPADIVFSWYSESWEYGSYDYSRPGTDNTGHFTQVVWKGSKKIGCGRTTFKSGGMTYTIIVARYSPPGNYGRRHIANVRPLKSGVTVPKSDGELEVQGACLDKSPNCGGFKSLCSSTNTMYVNVMKGSCYKTCFC